MAYVETVERNNKKYYYVVKNFRLKGNKWKKIRKYMGSRKPTEKGIGRALKEVEAKARSLGIGKISPFAYLLMEEAEQLEDVKDAFKRWYGKIPTVAREKYDESFLVRFTYNSNAIEGNRLSLRETAMILTEEIIPSGASTNDYNEALNSKDCLKFIRGYKGELNKRFLLKVHHLLTKNTKCRIVGRYRDSQVFIRGSGWTPPKAKEVPELMKKLFQWYNNHKRKRHPLELASITHTKLVQIHPFIDGNGRTSRVIMNWLLLKSSYPMFYIEVKEKMQYYNALEKADAGEMKEFVKYVARTIVHQFTFVSKDKT